MDTMHCYNSACSLWEPEKITALLIQGHHPAPRSHLSSRRHEADLAVRRTSVLQPRTPPPTERTLPQSLHDKEPKNYIPEKIPFHLHE